MASLLLTTKTGANERDPIANLERLIDWRLKPFIIVIVIVIIIMFIIIIIVEESMCWQFVCIVLWLAANWFYLSALLLCINLNNCLSYIQAEAL